VAQTATVKPETTEVKASARPKSAQDTTARKDDCGKSDAESEPKSPSPEDFAGFPATVKKVSIKSYTAKALIQPKRSESKELVLTLSAAKLPVIGSPLTNKRPTIADMPSPPNKSPLPTKPALSDKPTSPDKSAPRKVSSPSKTVVVVSRRSFVPEMTSARTTLGAQRLSWAPSEAGKSSPRVSASPAAAGAGSPGGEVPKTRASAAAQLATRVRQTRRSASTERK